MAAAGAVSSARADLLQARGALLPNVTANGIFANSSNQRFDQATGQLVSQNYTSQLQGSYEVFGAGRKFANLRASGADVDAAEARYRAQRFQTILQTTNLFYAAAGGADLVRVAEQRQARAQEQLKFAQVRLDLGTATTSDVLRAEIEVGNAELAVVDARATCGPASSRWGGRWSGRGREPGAGVPARSGARACRPRRSWCDGRSGDPPPWWRPTPP